MFNYMRVQQERQELRARMKMLREAIEEPHALDDGELLVLNRELCSLDSLHSILTDKAKLC